VAVCGRTIRIYMRFLLLPEMVLMLVFQSTVTKSQKKPSELILNQELLTDTTLSAAQKASIKTKYSEMVNKLTAKLSKESKVLKKDPTLKNAESVKELAVELVKLISEQFPLKYSVQDTLKSIPKPILGVDR